MEADDTGMAGLSPESSGQKLLMIARTRRPQQNEAAGNDAGERRRGSIGYTTGDGVSVLSGTICPIPEYLGALSGGPDRLTPGDREVATAAARPVLTTEQCDVCHPMGVIGFDVGRHSRRSGSRTQGYLVNDPCKTTGADSNRTDFILAA